MSLISSWLSTKTFAIVDISDYRRYTIPSSIGTTLIPALTSLPVSSDLSNHNKGENVKYKS